MKERARAIIAELNSLGVGQLDAIECKLDASRRAISAMGQEELAAKVDEARGHLARGDLASFRKAVAHVVSKLGHVRD